MVSQFTLLASTERGRRPSFERAALRPTPSRWSSRFAGACGKPALQVATGRFGAHMQVELVNDGPVTLVLDFPPAERLADQGSAERDLGIGTGMKQSAKDAAARTARPTPRAVERCRFVHDRRVPEADRARSAHQSNQPVQRSPTASSAAQRRAASDCSRPMTA